MAGGVTNFNLGELNKALRTVSLGSPVVQSLLLGGGLGLAGYYGGPWLTKQLVRLTSPRFANRIDELDQYTTKEDLAEQRKMWGWLGVLGGTALGLGVHFSPNAPGYGLLQFAPMQKTTSAGWDAIPLYQGLQLINDNPGLSPEMKLQASTLLTSFNAPPTATVTGNDLVGQAIATGQSAVTGLAVGYLTAHALGLPNPSSTAILGAVANTLGPKSALIASTVFGR